MISCERKIYFYKELKIEWVEVHNEIPIQTAIVKYNELDSVLAVLDSTGTLSLNVLSIPTISDLVSLEEIDENPINLSQINDTITKLEYDSQSVLINVDFSHKQIHSKNGKQQSQFSLNLTIRNSQSIPLLHSFDVILSATPPLVLFTKNQHIQILEGAFY